MPPLARAYYAIPFHIDQSQRSLLPDTIVPRIAQNSRSPLGFAESRSELLFLGVRAMMGIQTILFLLGYVEGVNAWVKNPPYVKEDLYGG